jgi:hypothetical protein
LTPGSWKNWLLIFLTRIRQTAACFPLKKPVLADQANFQYIGEKRFSASSRTRSTVSEEEVIEVYAFTTETPDNESAGYILACNDIRIGNILAVVEEGSLDSEEIGWFTDVVYEGLGEYIDNTIVEYDSISEEEITQALEKVTIQTARSSTTAYDIPYGYEVQEGSLGTSGLYQNGTNQVKQIVRVAYSWYDGYYATILAEWGQQSPYNYVINKARNGENKEPFPKPSGSDNKILNHPQGSQAEDGGE